MAKIVKDRTDVQVADGLAVSVELRPDELVLQTMEPGQLHRWTLTWDQVEQLVREHGEQLFG